MIIYVVFVLRDDIGSSGLERDRITLEDRLNQNHLRESPGTEPGWTN